LRIYQSLFASFNLFALGYFYQLSCIDVVINENQQSNLSHTADSGRVLFVFVLEGGLYLAVFAPDKGLFLPL